MNSYISIALEAKLVPPTLTACPEVYGKKRRDRGRHPEVVERQTFAALHKNRRGNDGSEEYKRDVEEKPRVADKQDSDCDQKQFFFLKKSLVVFFIEVIADERKKYGDGKRNKVVIPVMEPNVIQKP